MAGTSSLKSLKGKGIKEGKRGALALKNGKTKKSRASKEPEKVAKKRTKKAQNEAPKTRSSKKKKKQEESSSDDEEANQEADVDDDDVAEEDNEREQVSDVEDDPETKKANRTPEEIKAAQKHRTSQVRRKGRVRGYRHVALKAGYSPHYVSSASHLDVALPVLSDAETIRACQWAPKLADKAAYAGMEEFEERTQLSLESLPKSAAKVIRQSGEVYLRRLALGAMQRASDQQKTRASVSMVQAETRPLQRVQKYSFVAPHGLVRFAQGHDSAKYRINKMDEDVEQMAAEKKGILKEQPKLQEAMKAAKDALKKKKGDEEEEEEPQEAPAAKKRKKRASAA
jgi:hypothetical protein